MENSSDSYYREINFENIVVGTLIATNCSGRLRFNTFRKIFNIEFATIEDDRHKIKLNIEDVKRIYKTFQSDKMYIEFILRPTAIKTISESLSPKDYVFQISQNPDEKKFQVYFNSLDLDEINFMENFFSFHEKITVFQSVSIMIDIKMIFFTLFVVFGLIKQFSITKHLNTLGKMFAERPVHIVDENSRELPVNSQDTEIIVVEEKKVPVILSDNSIFKHRRKKLYPIEDTDKSEDYLPIKRQRKTSSASGGHEEEKKAAAATTPKRSLRTRNRDEVNLCEDLSEESQLQEALKRSLKGVDQTIIDSISLIETKSDEIEPESLFDNVDKTIELFSYETTFRNIIVRMEDYICLSKSEYLSDVIIDFYLHYIYNEKMTPAQREKTFIFGTYFYTLYSTSSEYSGWNNEENAGLNAKEKRYKRIEGILSDDVNIFEKDFIVIPLMDNNHWFLAIVCFPKLDGSYTINGNVKVEGDDLKRNPKKAQPAIKSSCILIFDSIKGNGSRRNVAMTHLKNFLEHEWMNKYKNQFHFDIKHIIGHSPKVPLQLNNVDCGCFILEFVERFFVTSPLEDYRVPIDLSNWFSPKDVRSYKRREIASIVQSMVENTEIEFPNIRFFGDSHKSKDIKVAAEPIEIDETLAKQDTIDNLIDAIYDDDGNGNENNNDETFNNNNDFNCLDSNNAQPIGNQNVLQIVAENENENEQMNEITSALTDDYLVEEMTDPDSIVEDEEKTDSPMDMETDGDIVEVEKEENEKCNTEQSLTDFDGESSHISQSITHGGNEPIVLSD